MNVCLKENSKTWGKFVRNIMSAPRNKLVPRRSVFCTLVKELELCVSMKINKTLHFELRLMFLSLKNSNKWGGFL
jgi:hypothetical protein